MAADAKPLSILVVDDDGFVRDMLREILLSGGHLVATAVDGRDALGRLAPAAGVDLIISDMDMPGMSGLELLRTLRESGSTTPLIFLTGNQELRVAIEALKKGANDYIIKDEHIEDTVAIAIANVMELHRLKMENLRLVEDLARKNRELERLTLLDGLTGVANRRYFDKTMQQEWSRAVREQSPIAVVMIDIDCFKAYNDTYGHQQGDACLRQVAAGLSAGLKRPSDFIARYGGEEFVAVLPDTGLEGARLLAEAMREQVARLDREHRASVVCGHITASLGVASVVPGRDSSYDELVKLADEALYSAKQQGRNRTSAATCR
jgi:diguanylate cyclase (GGDEF)-like protein